MPLSFLHGPEKIGVCRKPALVVAHPGHELKVFGWLAENAPRVYVLTDGSGANGASRLSSTTRVLGQAGATADEIFGLVSDAEVYRAILGKKAGVFLAIVDQLASSFAEHGIDFVAGDAVEGFNPTHDICRELVNAAVSIAERNTERTIANYEFCLTEWEQHGGLSRSSKKKLVGLTTVIIIGLLVESVVFRTVETHTVRKWGMQR